MYIITQFTDNIATLLANKSFFVFISYEFNLLIPKKIVTKQIH